MHIVEFLCCNNSNNNYDDVGDMNKDANANTNIVDILGGPGGSPSLFISAGSKF